MTKQVPDAVEFDGKTWITWDMPLDGFFIERGMATSLLGEGFHCTACNRGYVAGWVIEGDLLRIKTLISFGTNRDLFRRVFGFWRRNSIVAVWFTGDLRLYEKGDLLSERSLQLQIRAGRVLPIDSPLSRGITNA